MSDSYKTIKGISEGQYKDKGSKFLAFAYPVYTEEEIKEIQKGLRKEFHDARHHCFAYRLGAEKKIFRANDDGEPSNSSGKPILGQIQAFDLTNILIVVVRYFGGTLLGVGGLIQAYKTAATEALKKAEIINKTVNDIIDIRFEYLDMNDVMKILKSEKPEQLKQKFDIDCYIQLSIRQSATKKLLERLKKIESLKFEISGSR
ncbi:IMPACT family protein [Bacteroidota bacterium]